MSEKEPNIEEDVIQAILETWSEYPDMRLTQLIINALVPKEPCIEIYNTEDSQLIKKLKKFKNKKA